MRFHRLVALACTSTIMLVGTSQVAGALTPSPAPTPNAFIGTNTLVPGATLTQWTYDNAHPAAQERGLAHLHGASGYINVHLHGWGVGSPITATGAPRWDDLDKRFGMIADYQKRTGSNPKIVLTACCSPRNFVDPKFGDTDWFLKPPTRANYGNYAELVAATVQRYPQIEFIQVWNEMKGMNGPNRAQDYTDLYNAIWNAVKYPKVVNGVVVRPGRPDVKIGGPYVIMQTDGYKQGATIPICVRSIDGCFRQSNLDVVKYWLTHKVGADFVVFDSSNVNTNAVYNSNKFDRANNFTLAERWLRSLAADPAYADAATLPLWWAEYHIFSAGTMQQKTAYRASALMRTAKSNADVALIWGDEGDDSGIDNQSYEATLYTNTQTPNGGQPTPYFAVQKGFKDAFPRGTALYELANSNRNVDYLASAGTVMATNMTSKAQVATIGDVTISLAPFETKFVARPVPTRTFTIAPGESVDFTLQLAAGQRVDLSIQGQSAGTVLPASFSVVLRTDPYRPETRQFETVTADSSRATVTFTAPETSRYVLKLRSRSARAAVTGTLTGVLPLTTPS